MSQQQQQAVVAAAAAPNPQTVRDTKRILQVLLPALPAPAIDLCANTIFASTTAAHVHRRRTSSNGGANSRFKLRRMDSGNFGEFDICYPIGRKPNMRFANASNLSFDYQPASPGQQSAKRRA